MKRIYLVFCYLLAINHFVHAQQAKFDAKQPLINTGSSFDFVGTGDIDGDGLADICGATTNYFDTANDYKIFLWLQGSNGELRTALKFPYRRPGVATCFYISDLYNDGSSEILVGVGNYLYIYSWSNNNLSIEDSFLTINNYSEDGVTTGDFDSDGFIDIGISHWGGDRITVIYQKGESSKWDMRHYTMPTNGYGHVTAGRFGPLQQTALIYINGQGAVPISVITFSTTRTIQNKYDMQLPAQTGSVMPHSAVVVNKGLTGINELWAVYGGNKPSSMVAIWRGLQALPDSTFHTYDLPEAIQAANLDCDGDDETVILHAGFLRSTIYSDSMDYYYVPSTSHYKQDGLTIGDINNDGRKDICIATGVAGKGLMVLYNITSCWPAAIRQTGLSDDELTVTPNPAFDYIKISSQGTGILSATDATGRCIYSSQFDRESIIDIGQWTNGVYFMVLRKANGRVITKKLVTY